MSKSARTRASLIPYPVIAAAVGGDPEAVSRVVRHYSGYIAALSTRTSYGPDGYPRPQVDEDLRGRPVRQDPVASPQDGTPTKQESDKTGP